MSESDNIHTFLITIPAEFSKARLLSDLEELTTGEVEISLKSSSNSPKKSQLGQIDSTTIEIIIQILDTKASAAAVQATLGAVIGYVFAKTGKKPEKGAKDKDERL